MMKRRYTVLVIDQSRGVVRSATLSLRAAVCGAIIVLSYPVLLGAGARLSARAAIESLRATHTMLNEENASYRAATSAFTEQIRALRGVIDELRTNGESGHRPPTRQRAAVLDRDRAAGGTTLTGPAASSAAMPMARSSPDEIFQVLGGVLQVLKNRLPSLERTVERREALAAATPSIWPAHGWLTAPFGIRSDPFSGEQGLHQGIDISTSVGQPAYATADGVVASASPSGDYGNLVVLQHGFGLSTRYGHLSRFAVTPGVAVKRGDVIGYVGSTGRSTGPHVHYEILVNGMPIDPLQILTAATDRGTAVP